MSKEIDFKTVSEEIDLTTVSYPPSKDVFDVYGKYPNIPAGYRVVEFRPVGDISDTFISVLGNNPIATGKDVLPKNSDPRYPVLIVEPVPVPKKKKKKQRYVFTAVETDGQHIKGNFYFNHYTNSFVGNEWNWFDKDFKEFVRTEEEF